GRPDPLEQVEPGPVGQLKVEHDDVRSVLLDPAPALPERSGRDDLDLRGGEHPAERVADDRLVVNDQELRHLIALTGRVAFQAGATATPFSSLSIALGGWAPASGRAVSFRRSP